MDRFTKVRRELRRSLPQGQGLPEETFRSRHRAILALIAAHLPVLLVTGVLLGHPVVHAAGHVVPAAALGLLGRVLPGRRAQMLAATTALLTISATLVHMTDGLAEAHFHFFVALTVLAFYEDWAAFGLAVSYVVLHHGLAGAVFPLRVFDHPGAEDGRAAIKWALVHGGFIAAAATANVLLWSSNERSRLRAAMLARSLTPTTLPALRGARAAACHLPGEGDAGGDWLDLVTLPDGRLFVTLGDVIGHGPAVAGCAARLRHTARAYAEDGWNPARILQRLDRMAGDVRATALVALIDLDAETVTYSRAGHLPPVLRLGDGRTRLLEDGGGPMLAGFGLPHFDHTVSFPPGSTLVTCSDGLIERRGQSIDVGLGRLCDAVSCSSGCPDELAATMPAVLDSRASADDVALLAVRAG